jgi:hypothetical protein
VQCLPQMMHPAYFFFLQGLAPPLTPSKTLKLNE